MIKDKIKGIGFGLSGATAGALGLLGLACPCSFPLAGVIVGALGISALFLVENHFLFLIAGFVLLGLSVFFLLKSGQKCTCGKANKPKRKT